VTVVVAVAFPEVPTIVTGYVPATAELLTMKVSDMVLEFTVAK